MIINNKKVDLSTVEIENINTADYPDFADAYAIYAEFTDGSELTEEELDELGFEGVVGELILENQLYM